MWKLYLAVWYIGMCAITYATYPEVSYQVHSMNDLTEWHQLMLKGATRFKVDPHYTDSASCLQAGIIADEGCLLLSHDDPDTDSATYSSANDLVSFLYSDEFKLLQNGQNISIALCFKSAPDKCQNNSDTFQNWLYLVDNLHAKLTVDGGPTGVEIILDGDGKPVDCLVGRWNPWMSVWIDNSSPAGALYSNSIENDYYRYQVLNDPEGWMDWAQMVEQDYGKFSSSIYPYQLWEPDSQRVILDYISIYEAGARHLPGFHFAINIDVAMFGLYSATPPTETVNIMVPNSANTTSPHVLQVCGDSNTRELFLYLLMKGAKLLYGYVTATGILPDDEDLVELPNSSLLFQGGSSTVASVSVDHTQTTILIVSDSGLALFYSLSCGPDESLWLEYMDDDTLLTHSDFIYGDAVLTTCSSLPRFMLSLRQRQDVEKIFQSQQDLCIISTEYPVSVEGSQRMILSAYVVESSGKDMSIEFFSSAPVTTPANTIDGSGVISSARLRVLEGEEGSEDTFVILYVAMDLHMYVGSISVNAGSRWGLVSDVLDPLSAGWLYIGVGEKIDVSVSSPPGTLAHGNMDSVIMVVSDFGYCFNSHKHNTRSSPMICTSSADPSKHVLDYSLGFVRDWLNVSSAITPCHARIFHGSYQQGSNPSVAVSTTYKESANGQIDFITFEVHEALLDSLSPLANGCGNPVHRNGVVLSSFPFSSWMSNMRRYVNSEMK